MRDDQPASHRSVLDPTLHPARSETGAPDATASTRHHDALQDAAEREARTRAAQSGDALRDEDRRDLHAAANPGDEIGEAVGGISGVLTGAALGSLGGPIGTIIGGIAGAVSGWWAGRAISEAASAVTDDDETHYRTHHTSAHARGPEHPARDATRATPRGYDDVRPAYQLGHVAGRNPDYRERSFEEIEGDLRHGWNADVSERHGRWEEVRDLARHAFERGRATGSAGTSGPRDASALDGGTGRAIGAGVGEALTGGHGARGTDAHAGRLPMQDANASRALGDRQGHPATGVERAVDRTATGAERLADRAADALDDAKDRVDGNPASRPGPDATDRRERF